MNKQNKQLNTKEALNELFEKTSQFNRVSNNFEKPLELFLKDQIPRIEEETAEIRQGFEEKNMVKVLDGCVDTLVCIKGVLAKLEMLGIDINSAMVDTADNNLSKFTNDESLADKTIEFYKLSGVDTYKVFNKEYGLWVVKRGSDNKVMKPVGYIPNDLTNAVPVDLRRL